MRRILMKAILPFLAVLFVASTASAASVSGTITDLNGAGLGDGNIQVRLWEQTPKGFTVAYTTVTGTGGTYSFSNVDAGNYKLNARMAPGFSGHYGDTWYDVDPPNSNGVFAADADILVLEPGDVLTGMDISLPLTGGFHGTVYSPAPMSALSNIRVRAESLTDYRYHHNDLTKGYFPRIGQFSMRGLRATHNFRIVIYDPLGRYETMVVPGPFSFSNLQDIDTGAHQLTAIGTDPNEPNNTAAQATQVPNLPFESNDAIIYPRGSDVDWYCLEVDEGDRLLARADANITIGGEERLHPWIDPIMAFFNGDGSQLITWNDDDPNANTLSSFIDTGILEAGEYCFVVSTFGDQNWTGTGQQTAGRYTFGVEMGNRAPHITVYSEGDLVPRAPDVIVVDEGDEVVFDLTFGDPDGDAVQPVVTHVDSNGDPVAGDLTSGASTGTYEWSVAQTAANLSPYELIFTVDDGEFVTEYAIVVEVEAVNLPPTTPVPVSPIGGIRVDVNEVPLVVTNATDPDEDDLIYQYQLHEGAIQGGADQNGSIDEDASGTTTWTTGPITENAVVSWRVRAFDGNPDNGYSPWSDWETFMVDTTNHPPETPQIVKPEPNEIVLTTTPRIASTVPADPDMDPISIIFEIAEENDFAALAASSDPVAAGSANTVEWTTEPALTAGTRYYVRAMAIDDRGGESDWSDPVSFRVRPDSDSPPPTFTGDLAHQCEQGWVIEDAPDSLTVNNVDGSGAALSFELHILRDGATVYEITVPQSEGGQTEIDVDPSVFETPGHYQIRVRTVIDGENSEWLECQASVENGGGGGGGGGGGDGDPMGDVHAEEGCGCSATSSPEGAGWMAFLLMLAFGYGRRRQLFGFIARSDCR